MPYKSVWAIKNKTLTKVFIDEIKYKKIDILDKIGESHMIIKSKNID